MAVHYTEVKFVLQNGVRYRDVSLFLSTIKRFFYEPLIMTASVLRNCVRYKEVSAIKLVRYREVVGRGRNFKISLNWGRVLVN